MKKQMPNLTTNKTNAGFNIFIRLRLNTLQLVGVRKSRHAAGKRQGEPRRSSSDRRRAKSYGYHFNVGMATAQFRFDTLQLAAGSFIL